MSAYAGRAGRTAHGTVDHILTWAQNDHDDCGRAVTLCGADRGRRVHYTRELSEVNPIALCRFCRRDLAKINAGVAEALS